MSIPFPPDRENDVTTLPLAGQYQRFTGAFPPFAAPLPLFFSFADDAVFLPPDACEADFLVPDGALEALLELADDVLEDRRFDAGGGDRRSFCPG